MPVASYLPLANCYLPLVDVAPFVPFAASAADVAVCRLPFATRRLPHAACCSLLAARVLYCKTTRVIGMPAQLKTCNNAMRHIPHAWKRLPSLNMARHKLVLPHRPKHNIISSCPHALAYSGCSLQLGDSKRQPRHRLLRSFGGAQEHISTSTIYDNKSSSADPADNGRRMRQVNLCRGIQTTS